MLGRLLQRSLRGWPGQGRRQMPEAFSLWVAVQPGPMESAMKQMAMGSHHRAPQETVAGLKWMSGGWLLTLVRQS